MQPREQRSSSRNGKGIGLVIGGMFAEEDGRSAIVVGAHHQRSAVADVAELVVDTLYGDELIEQEAQSTQLHAPRVAGALHILPDPHFIQGAPLKK